MFTLRVFCTISARMCEPDGRPSMWQVIPLSAASASLEPYIILQYTHYKHQNNQLNDCTCFLVQALPAKSSNAEKYASLASSRLPPLILQASSRPHPGLIQASSMDPPGLIQASSMDHPGPIQAASRLPPGLVQASSMVVTMACAHSNILCY